LIEEIVMSDDDNRKTLELVSAVLLRCFLLGVALQVIWFVMVLLMGDWAHSIHARIFDVSKKEFDLLCYYGMAFVKTIVILGFLIPWAATKLVLRAK
jgi:hypothetical protein